MPRTSQTSNTIPVISETRLSVTTTSTHWIVENFQFPEPITREFVKTHSREEIKLFTQKDETQVFTDEERRQADNERVKEWTKTTAGYRYSSNENEKPT